MSVSLGKLKNCVHLCCWLKSDFTIKMLYKFGQVQISNKNFNSEYNVTKIVDLEKIRVGEGIVANKHDTRYTIGYEVEPGKIVPLYIKTPKDCDSSGVSRYNEASAWKMGFKVVEEEAWIKQYEGIWEKVEELMFQKLTGTLLSNDKYINPKLITWDGEIRTKFKGNAWVKPEDIGACQATGILKIGSVYRKGSNYHLQVFLKECKYKQRDTCFKSQLSDDDEDSGYDTVH